MSSCRRAAAVIAGRVPRDGRTRPKGPGSSAGHPLGGVCRRADISTVARVGATGDRIDGSGERRGRHRRQREQAKEARQTGKRLAQPRTAERLHRGPSCGRAPRLEFPDALRVAMQVCNSPSPLRSARFEPRRGIALTFPAPHAPAVAALLACATVLGGASPRRRREQIGASRRRRSAESTPTTRGTPPPSRFATVDGAPHVGMDRGHHGPGQGDSNGIDVARLSADGTTWTRLAPGSPITRLATASTSAEPPRRVEGFPWVTSAETPTRRVRDIHVTRLAPSGAKWLQWTTATTGSVARSQRTGQRYLGRPSIAASGSRPYVAFWELDPGTGSLLGPLAPGGPYAPGERLMRLGAVEGRGRRSAVGR